MEPGSKLGHYTISSLIGKGGMGEVYQAKDEKLGRQVAIKLLPEEFAQDTDRVARFRREAQLLASLNHPNIAAIHGLEEKDEKHFLVLELVEGPTLSDRIKQGAIPVEESLKLALQIAEALEAAHEKGVIHRDLKPANIKITNDGKIKVLDFGLAKALESDTADAGLSNSPTLSMAATQQGVILGTAAYMSPEQVRGREVDKRTDVWAFGCVLYEMLTGKVAFGGEDVTEILGAVVRLEPAWRNLPADLHPRLREVLERCLEKKTVERTRDIGDAQLDIKKILADPGGILAQPVAEVPQVAKSRLQWVAGLIVGTVVAGLAGWGLQPSPVRPVARLSVNVPAGSPELSGIRMALSADGRTIVYAADMLSRRELGEVDSQPIPGTEGGVSPFYSPNGQWIGFIGADQGLWKVSTAGGPPVRLGGTLVRGAAYRNDDMIVFGTPGGLFQISSDGGEATPITSFDQGDPGSHRYPDVLPSGEAALFVLSTGSIETSQVAVVDLETGDYRSLVNGVSPRYLPTGHIVFGREESLWAIPFDVELREVTGTAVPVFVGIYVSAEGGAQFAVGGGSLVYLPVGGAVNNGLRLVWVNRDGGREPIGTIPMGRYQFPRLSPSGESILLWEDNDAWIYDIASGRRSAVTTDSSGAGDAEWDPTSPQIAYSSQRAGALNIFVQPLDGGSPRQLTNLPGPVEVDSWSPDGTMLAAHYHPPGGGTDILMIPIGEANAEPQGFLETEFNEEGAVFSPDGRYVAYASEETGQRAVYIRPFRGPGPQTPISVDGGTAPVWRRGELFYRHLASGNMMAVSVATDPTLEIGDARELFSGAFSSAGFRPNYDVTPDGQRFLILETADLTNVSDAPVSTPQLNIVLNWDRELPERVPVP